MKRNPSPYDVAVVGAGVFGAWTALHLRRRRQRVLLLDAYGPANSRASSGGESRIIRMGYGPDEIYTHFALRSFKLWQELFEPLALPLFWQTGMLWLAAQNERYVAATRRTLEKFGVGHEVLSPGQIRTRFPQFSLPANTWGLLEPQSGVILARRAVEAVVKAAVRSGVEYRQISIENPRGKGRLHSLITCRGDVIPAGAYVFACGAWLPAIFPRLLRRRIFPTRQEVFFVGPPAGDLSFTAPAMPAWYDRAQEAYGIPSLESRGFKVAFDAHGPDFDPESGTRVVSAVGLSKLRNYLQRRFPALRVAPIVETRVCQYENTWNGDFLIDQHPELDNVWIVGGGSGHGFKHGPAVGEYAVGLVLDNVVREPRFALAGKKTVQRRMVH